MPRQPSKRTPIAVTITHATALTGVQSAIRLIVTSAARIEVSE